MAKSRIKDPKLVVCTVLFVICSGGMITFFIVGGLFYAKERPKVLNYANSMCRVDSISYKTYQCTTRYYRYDCYGPIWDVHHGENRTIFALVEGDKRYRSSLDALKKAQEYQVTKPTKQRKPFKIHLIENFDGSFRNKCESLFFESIV
jgi:hypothetical protein